MLVQHLMTREVQSCHPEDTLNSASEKLWTHDIGCLPVVDNGYVIGMITDRDICMAAYTKGCTLNEIPVAIAMAKIVYTCSVNDSIKDAERLMRLHQIRRLPILSDEGKLVGIVSLNDIAREAEREVELKAHDISAEEVTATLATVIQPRQHNELTAS